MTTGEWILLGIRTVIPLVVTALAVGFGLRIVAREFFRARREASIGRLMWVEVIHEARTATGRRERAYEPSDFGGIAALFDSIRSDRWPYRGRGVASFAWVRGTDGLVHLYVGVTAAHASSGSVFEALADTLGGRVERIDGVPPIPIEALVVAHRSRATPQSVREKVESAGAVATAVSTVFEQIDRSETGALVVTLDMLRNSEGSRLQANVGEEDVMRGGASATFQSMQGQARIMVTRSSRATIAASNSSGDVRLSKEILTSAVNATSTLGWLTTPVVPGARHARSTITFGLVALGIVTAAGMVGLIPLAIAIVLGAPLAALLAVAVVFPNLLAADPMRRRLATGEVTVPAFYWWNLRWKIHGLIRSNRSNANDDRDRVGNKVAPPSARGVLYLHAAAAFEALSFPDRMAVDVHADSVQSRGLPAHMVDTEWPIFYGISGTGQFVCGELKDLHYSFYTAGAPGAGKTNLLQVIYAGAVKASLEHHANLSITPIWAETKGEGAYEAWLIARNHPGAMFVDSHNPKSKYRLALEGRRISEGATPDEVVRNAASFVNALQFAFGTGIMASGRELLENAIRIALLLDSSEIKHLELDNFVDPHKPNVIDLAFYVLGGDTRVEVGTKLLAFADELDAGTLDERTAPIRESIGTLSSFIDPKSRGKLVDRLSAARNKLGELRGARTLFTPDDRRVDAYVADFPSLFAPLVVNMGPFHVGGGEFDQSITPALARRLILVMNFELWEVVKSKCSGWLRQGKRVPVFFDELADVAIDSTSEEIPNVYAEAMKEGRSRGYSIYSGSQFPGQMPLQAKHNALASRTKFWFGVHNPDDLRMAVDDLSSGDKDRAVYDMNSIRTLTEGVCAGIMKRLDTVSPPFTLLVPFAPKWAEILFRPGNEVEDAIADYVQWQQEESYALTSAVPPKALTR